MKNPIDDTQVSLEGYVTRKIPGSKDHYEFKDLKGGVIDVEIDHDKWPTGVSISEKTKVTIVGEVDVDHDYGRRFVNIDVDSSQPNQFLLTSNQTVLDYLFFSSDNSSLMAKAWVKE